MSGIELHRCRFVWAKAERHPCWRVQSALDEAGVQYRILKEPVLRGRRKAVIAGTGQSQPAVRRDDGSWYRKESAEMAAEIRDGRVSLAESAPVEGAPGGDGSPPDPSVS